MTNPTPVPKLDLAPKLNRPLQLWNPLDYLRLLYWVFFFPQAVRWYEDTFSRIKHDTMNRSVRYFWSLLWIDSIRRNFLIQGSILTFLMLGLLNLMLFGRTDFQFFTLSLLFGTLLCTVVIVTNSTILGVGLGVTDGCIASIMAVALTGLWHDMQNGWVFTVLSVGVGLGTGLIINIRSSEPSGIPQEMITNLLFGISSGLVLAMLSPVIGPTIGSIFDGRSDLVSDFFLKFGLSFSLSLLLFSIRLPDYLVAVIFTLLLGQSKNQSQQTIATHVTWLPLPGIQSKLTNRLCQNTNTGISSVNDLLAYSFQFIPVVGAVNKWLEQIEPKNKLQGVSSLATDPFDWKIVQFGSASLSRTMLRSAFFFLYPGWWDWRSPSQLKVELRLDAPNRIACAGYWFLHEKQTAEAVEAFAKVKDLPYGESLYRSVLALHQAQDCAGVKEVAGWVKQTNWLNPLPEEPLRPQAVETLKRLRNVALEAQVAQESYSKLNRSAALGRAGAELTRLIEDVEQTCPYPEWPIVKEIAEKWRDILAKAAGEIGQLAITKPVENPYIVGNPVGGRLFVGREEILKRLEELWGSDPTKHAPSVVLFGHRRMGKTSILQNLGTRFGLNTVVAYFTMQRLGRVQHTGELLYALALELYDALRESVNSEQWTVNSGEAARSGDRPQPTERRGVSPDTPRSASGDAELLLEDKRGQLAALQEPKMEAFNENGYAAFNRFLRGVKQVIGGRRVILAIDEFELIEKAIEEKQVEKELLAYLRGVIHSEPWLIFALAGLHTLEEMTADYWNPLFASITPVRVSFFSKDATGQLLANPYDDFPLDFTRDTVERVYEYVRGQPYLTQLVGHSLVRLYNQSVFEAGQPRSARFTPEDVDAVVLSPAFYEQGNYYFHGVWSQAERSEVAGQTAVLHALAQVEGTVTAESLFAQTGLPETAGQAALAALKQHDVVQETAEGVDFTVPLLRWWIRNVKRET